ERRENPVDGDGSVAPEVEEKPEIDLEDWLSGGDATPPTNSGPPFGQIPFAVVGTRMPSTPATLCISLTANAWLGNGMAPMGSILNPVVDDAAVITLDGNPASLADVPSGATCDCLMYRQGNVWIVFDILAWSGNGPYFPM